MREFGSPYLSETEIELLAAMVWLQQGQIHLAERVLARYASSRNLPSVLQAADFWTMRLKQIGVQLAPFVESPFVTSESPRSEPRIEQREPELLN